jgi:subtilisin family serine protease
VAEGDFTGTGDGGTDDDGHGTAVAGIAVGRSGVAPKARIWAIKVLDSEGEGTSVQTLAALDALLRHVNDFGGLDVVNMSFGGGLFAGVCDNLDPAITQAFKALENAGVAIFSSSGNEASKNKIGWPACQSSVMSVGAVYDANIGGVSFSSCRDNVTGPLRVACYSNSGAQLDFLAPAHCTTTSQMGGGTISCFGGTSASSPYAAGVAAQLLSLRPGTSPAALRNALATTGKAIKDPANGLVRRRIDAVAALGKLATSGGGAGGGAGSGAVGKADNGLGNQVRNVSAKVEGQVLASREAHAKREMLRSRIYSRIAVMVRLGPNTKAKSYGILLPTKQVLDAHVDLDSIVDLLY